MEKVIADWVMVSTDEMVYGTKKVKDNEHIMYLSELQEMVNDLLDEDNLNHQTWDYFFNDYLAVKEGVFKWANGRFKKVANDYYKLSKPKKLFGEEFIKEVERKEESEWSH